MAAKKTCPADTGDGHLRPGQVVKEDDLRSNMRSLNFVNGQSD